jgi:hypothetical protein
VNDKGLSRLHDYRKATHSGGSKRRSVHTEWLKTSDKKDGAVSKFEVRIPTITGHPPAGKVNKK